MRTRIGTRLVLGAGLATAVVIGGMAFAVLRAHTAQLLAERTRSADQLSETIKSATHFDMLENRRENLHRQIRAVGDLREEGIRKVRVFNKEGRIMFSSAEEEIGTSLDIRGEACYACHAEGRPLERLGIQARARTFRAPDGTRILGLINPIPNEPSCSTAACHAHSGKQSLLGVLDVNVSLAEVDREIRHSRTLMVLSATVAILAGGLILWFLNRSLVVKPVAALVAGTRRVGEGDLGTTIPVSGNHELGELAGAFNTMSQRLAETQRQLAQADKLASVGRLAAGVAHEINNPLTGVLSYASLLRKRLDGDKESCDDLDVIVRETVRCRGIIRGLLDFARPTPPARKPMDLNEVVRRAVSVVMTQLSLNQVDLSLDLAPQLPVVHADANQIQQVAVNLLLNAGDAINGDGGTIRLTTRAGAEGSVEMLVQDNGRGIPAEDLPRIFEPFYTTKGSHGTGLGLAVSWGIVEAHGGTLEVHSDPGQGACFTLRIPASAGPGEGTGPLPIPTTT
ncbi:MAG TPA: ATP-binding protein [Geothrix sp.]|uniref:sensor histidine kinase n=1 Tax=Geothrix mesophila TaxID=2922723 RepID=UPI001FABD7D1|nr:ATP-binding protein [Geothrix sp. SG198]HJV39289.1 ATP-binding protein [Geothrix sp.]